MCKPMGEVDDTSMLVTDGETEKAPTVIKVLALYALYVVQPVDNPVDNPLSEHPRASPYLAHEG